ncbi:MAG: TlpA family protein disulfide reductase [Deltaproteobacteria bacterium]|nr:MAG: TlpA family protein disulfide reductase [Deltaproteobacteria bacterium]
MWSLRLRIALLAAFVLVPLLLVLGLSFGHDPHAVPFMLQGQAAPDFTLAQINGGEVRLAALRGRPVVLNFWATWCYPCQAEHNLLQQAARHYGERVHFLGVVYQDTDSAVRTYLRSHPSAYPHVHDADSKVSIDYGVAGVPESYILDPQGTILFKQAGVLTAAMLQQHLDPLVGGAP